MEMNNVGAIILIVLVLITFSTMYILYTMYNENIETKNQIESIERTISENSNRLKKNEQQLLELTYEDDETNDEYDDETNEEEFHVHNDSKNMDMFDQFIINSENLSHLQKIQQEINSPSSKIEETESNNSDSSSESEEPETIEEPVEISFEENDDVTSKCTQELKTGKNKGSLCQKDALSGTLLCKSHTK